MKLSAIIPRRKTLTLMMNIPDEAPSENKQNINERPTTRTSTFVFLVLLDIAILFMLSFSTWEVG